MTEETYTPIKYEPGPYIYVSRLGREPSTSQCCADVGKNFRSEQCRKPAKYRETYKGEERGFCGTHRPSAYAKREAERLARWSAERKQSLERWARDDALSAARKNAKAALESLMYHAELSGDKFVRKTAKAALEMYPEGSEG